MREIDPIPVTELNPADAAKLGVVTGDWVKVTTPFGSFKQSVLVTPTIKEGVAHAQHAWWYPEQEADEPNLFGNWKSSVNVGMPNHYTGVQGWGNLNKNIIAKIEKTENDVTEITSGDDIVRIAKRDGIA